MAMETGIYRDMYLIETDVNELETTLEKTNIKGILLVDFQNGNVVFDCDTYHLELNCDSIETAENSKIIAAFEIHQSYVFSKCAPILIEENS